MIPKATISCSYLLFNLILLFWIYDKKLVECARISCSNLESARNSLSLGSRIRFEFSSRRSSCSIHCSLRWILSDLAASFKFSSFAFIDGILQTQYRQLLRLTSTEHPCPLLHESIQKFDRGTSLVHSISHLLCSLLPESWPSKVQLWYHLSPANQLQQH